MQLHDAAVLHAVKVNHGNSVQYDGISLQILRFIIL